MSPYAFPSIYNSVVPVVVDVDVDAAAIVVAITDTVASSRRPVVTCKHYSLSSETFSSMLHPSAPL